MSKYAILLTIISPDIVDMPEISFVLLDSYEEAVDKLKYYVDDWNNKYNINLIKKYDFEDYICYSCTSEDEYRFSIELRKAV